MFGLFESWISQINLIIPYLQINEFVKRARAAKIHAHIIGHLKKEMPAMMGKAKAQQRLIDNLETEFAKVSSLCKPVISGHFGAVVVL